MEEVGMNILVTGSEGYIGSVLMPMLSQELFTITGYDICFFKKGLIYNALVNYKLIKKDIRDISIDDLIGIDIVVHLAALSNDPLGDLNESLTYDINYHSSVRLAKLAKEAGVKRFIFSSSCSLYGFSNELLSEDSTPNPQTAYGRSKILAECDIAQLADDNFSPVFMRNATAFGVSPRIRFDIVVNNLTGYAHTIGKIKMLSDGSAWRPLAHVSDICRAIISVIKAPIENIHNQAFNVGSDSENYQIKDIAQIIAPIFKDAQINFANNNLSGDSRSYNVSFKKLQSALSFKCNISLEEGVEELQDTYNYIDLTEEIFTNRYFTRLNHIEYLKRNNKLDNKLRQINDF
jgi:nucleoside-diphosphate-sugar epimerase